MMCVYKIIIIILHRKNDLVGLNNRLKNNCGEKWTNLLKFIGILIEITRILIDIIILVKIRILVNFTRNIVSIRIPVISLN